MKIQALLIAVCLLGLFYHFYKNKYIQIKNLPITTNSNVELANPNIKMTIALISDSHNNNNNLQTALTIAKKKKADFVIHLGDLTNVGTKKELENAKMVLDNSGLKYFVLPGDHEYYVSEWNGVPSISNFTSLFGDTDSWLVFSQSGENSNFEFLIAKQNTNSNFQNGEVFLFTHQPLYPLGKDPDLLEKVRNSNIKAVFSGDLHFGSKTIDSVRSSLTHFVIGALAKERNLQSPRFSILRIYEDGGYNLEEIIL